jgi:hypothetical protein
MEERKAITRLTDDEKYSVYKYVIENRCVIQNGEEFQFRVQMAQIAKEINILKVVRPITHVHVKNSVDEVIGWQKRLNKIPVVPKETVEMDKLIIHNNRLTRENAELKNELEQLQKAALKSSSDAEMKLNRIKSILGA